ncbi:ribosomal RNA small subunit methyltransferase A [Candidatus Falkowbacteria bacterium CG10_big_fil_rev_8_21_14_0_10_43_10]|uniref:Ribosomal RNA small subunit methyltransferase A n=1 Tax=Candidatus Falkowbacteria bacterium CG10_big_fil_rev_8_21_14_0_10_43_10 TaxID=1974567 RepID=A0A2H0V0Z7_9BACT|nr:MAG: ribosomal RNA small subunit methyltransferase A [Candidatus Falkowbacteria bacterium CG10_big_fil_rev_8_21_14_0_10_43_10]
MDFLKQIKQLCALYNIKPARSRGQNFLISENVYQKIITAAGLKPDDIVLEVGPGLGFLTEMLARRVKKVIAVELDDQLAEVLRERLAEQKIENVEVVNEDIFIFNPSRLASLRHPPLTKGREGRGSYKIVANLPYNITSRFLRKFLEEVEGKPSMMVLMVQKEVAERITAKPPQMSLLAVSVQFFAEAKIMAKVSSGAFWPQPKVDSAIIHLTPRPPLPLASLKLRRSGRGEGVVDEKNFFKLVRVGFSARRKMLKNNLAKGLNVKSEIMAEILRQAGLNEKTRAQELSVEKWQELFIVLDRQNMV